MRKTLIVTAVALALGSLEARAQQSGPAAGTLPGGGRVVAGQASINQSGSAMQIQQASSRAALDWQSFSIGSAASVTFNQPSASAIALNRVLGPDASQIFGRLSANGQVFLLNPNGVLFARGAQVDVGGLLASTLGMQADDFMAGRYTLRGDGASGSILNQGTLRALPGGYVALIAPAVANEGMIETPRGTTALVGAGAATMSFLADGLVQVRVDEGALSAEIANSGAIRADGGAVLLTARARDSLGRAVVNSSGIVQARGVENVNGVIRLVGDVAIHTGELDASGPSGGSISLQARNVLSAGRMNADGSQGAGGEIDVQASGRILQTSAAHLSADGAGGGKVTLQAADRVFGSGTLTAIGQGAGSTGGEIKVLGNDIVLLGANLDASGDARGGTVLIGGDFQGNNPAVQNAATNWINFSSTIIADARNGGDGGRVIVWSDQQTQFYGSISARGGAISGDGGFIEVSGKENLVFGGIADAGAPNGTPGTLLLDPKFIVIDSAGGGGVSSFLLVDPNPGAGDGFAQQVVVLPNDNVVATDPLDDFTTDNGGAVYLFNGGTGALISTLTGSTAGDQVGLSGVTALTNGNYLVRSASWDNGAATNAGAVTFGSGTTGVSGTVSGANSLVGTSANDLVGQNNVTLLSNGNYVVRSQNWDNGAATNAGAVTFGNGTTGISGAVSTANSLVGATTNDFVGGNLSSVFGANVVALTNGNYVVRSVDWDNGAAANAGAVTFGSGTTGVSGAVSAANSLVGSTASDLIGRDGVTALTNGNYVVASLTWDNGAVVQAGAVTFGSGTTGISGAVSAANSLVGTTFNDQVGGARVTALSNGNYLVISTNWSNGAATQAGAVTFGNGTTGISGAVSAANSLVGTTLGDLVGNGGVTELTNGNYVVRSSNWVNGAATAAGAVTFGNGATGISGAVSAANSLVGTTTGDGVGAVTALTNGNYVVSSGGWDNGAATNAGAVTFGSGTTGVSGAVSAANSLVGTTADDGVGAFTALTNGNYVVASSSWDNGAVVNAGAVTFANGATGISGAVNALNSLVGSTANDRIGFDGVTALTNGNYVVRSSNWNNVGATAAGAATFGNGTTGVSGVVSAANSLVGTTAFDNIGINGVTALTNGNYVVRSDNWDNVGAIAAGAVTFGNGTTGVSGVVSAANSLVGTTGFSFVGNNGVTALTNGNYVVNSAEWDNGTTTNVGAVTFGSGTTGVSGAVSAVNSLVGTIANDRIGSGGVTPLSNGNVVVRSPIADNGAVVDAGLVHVLSPGGGGPLTNPLGFADNAAGTTTITPAQITAITNAGTAVTLQANTDITLAAASDIVTNNPGGNGGALLLAAGRSVILNSSITTDNGDLTITANDPGAQAANRDAGAGGITMAPGTTLNAGTGTVALTVAPGVPGNASGNLVVENIIAANVNLQQTGRSPGNSILRASGNSLITATNLLLEVDLDDAVTGGSVGTAAAPMRVAATNLESHTHEASPGIFIDSPTQGLTIGDVPFFFGSVKGVQNVTSGDISITANGDLTTLAGTAGCGATGGTGGPVCTGSSITLAAGNGDLSIGNVITHIGAGAGSLTARASNSILVSSGADITSGGGAFGITLNSDSDASGAGAVVLGNFAPLVTINSNGGNILIGGGSAAAGFAVGEGANTFGVHLDGAALNSGAGSITLRGQGLAGLGRGVSMQTGSGSSIQSTSGDIAIFGNADAGAEPAIRISQLQTVTSASGNIALTGNSGAVGGRGIEMFGQAATGGDIALAGTGGAGGSAAFGIEVANGGVVGASGSGTVLLTGQGGAGTDTNRGVSISGPTSAVTSVNGNITINATGGASLSSDNVGLKLDSSARIESTGAGSISITGISGGGTNNNPGVHINPGTIRTSAGNIFIQGTGAGTGIANRGIHRNGGTLQVQSGTGTITLTGQGSNTGTSFNDGIEVQGGGTFSTAGGNVSITGTGGTSATGGSNDGVSIGAVSVLAGGTGNLTITGNSGSGSSGSNVGVDLALGVQSLLTASGNLMITGTSTGSGGNNKGIKLNTGTLQSSGSGSVTLVGQAGSGGAFNDGINLQGGTFISSMGGNISLSGTGGAGTNNNSGIEVGAAVSTIGTGTLTISGLGGGGTTNSPGVSLCGGGCTTVNGAITITGTGTASDQGFGVVFNSGSIESTGGAPITITGVGTGSSFTNGVRGGAAIGNSAYPSTIIIRASAPAGQDSIQMPFLLGSGQLFIEPVNAATTVGVAGGTGDMDLDTADLSNIANGFSQITIGHPAGTGLISVGSHAFNDPILIRNTGGGSAGIVTNGNLAAGTNDLNLFSAGLVNVAQGTISGANIGINAASLIVQPGAPATTSALVNAAGDLTVNANSVQLRGSDTSAGLTAKLQAAGAVTINAGSVVVEGGDANNASAVIDPVGVTMTTTGNVTLQGGAGSDAYALLLSPAGNIAATAGGTISLLAGTGLNANAAIVASTGMVTLTAPACVGCDVLALNPWTGSQLLQTGVFGAGGVTFQGPAQAQTGSAVEPAAYVDALNTVSNPGGTTSPPGALYGDPAGPLASPAPLLIVPPNALMIPDFGALLEEMKAKRDRKRNALAKAVRMLEEDPTIADLPSCAGPAGGDCIVVRDDATPPGERELPAPKLVHLPSIERKLALLIGVADYAEPIPSLESPVKDIEEIARIYREQLGYEVRILADADKAAIVRELNRLILETRPGDSVTVMYAGHGHVVERTQRGYWIPAKAPADDPTQWISNTDIAKVLENIAARQLLLVSDSCYSGTLAREAKIERAEVLPDPAAVLGRRSVTVLTSGGEEPVPDQGKDGHSVFAWHFMRQLREVRDVTLGVNLHERVAERVQADIPQQPQYGAGLASGHQRGGDYLFEVRRYE